jgi:SagB-type dehydrogenase family enzyme
MALSDHVLRMSLDRPSRRTIVTLVAVGILSLLVDIVVGAFRVVRTDGGGEGVTRSTASVSLPAPRQESDVSIERAIADRRSRREYADRPLGRRDLGQLLWAAQGVTAPRSGHRAAPSAGALYPLELYVVVGESGVAGIESGVYRYRPDRHDLVTLRSEDVQSQLQAAAVDQDHVGEAAVDVVICAVDERTTRKYGERGRLRYVPMEAGHAGQNLYLQAESLDLSTVAIGAFGDRRVRELVGAPSDQRPLYIFPVGVRP